MAIGTAAALIGSAVIGAGTAAYSASQQKKAAKSAQQSAERTADLQLAEQRAAREQIAALQQPFIQGGQSAFQALLAEYGLASAPQQPQAPAGGSGFTKTPGGFAGTSPIRNDGPDWAGYVQSNPDLMADFQANQGMYPSIEAFGQQHYQMAGQAEGRPLPMPQVPQQEPAQATTLPAPATTQAAQPVAPTFQRPQGPAAPTFQRPADAPLPTFERPELPQYQAPQGPSQFSFDPANITSDPGYQFRLNETLKGVNAASAARGKLRSGDAAAALADRASGLASQEVANAFARQLAGWQANTGQFNQDRAFGFNVFQDSANRGERAFENDRSYGTNLALNQQARGDNIFADDRAYDTSRWQYDTERMSRDFESDRAYGTGRFESDRAFNTGRQDKRISDLFGLAGIGTGAAGSVGGAAMNFANNAGNIFAQQGQAAADAAAQRASANAQLAGSLGGIGANLFANWGGGSGPRVTPGMMQQPWSPQGLTTMPQVTF